MTADPALSFWLRYTQAEGALHDITGGGTAIVLLPESLQAELGLPEEVSVTADPEVAREDGALLLAPGHPALDGAAERLLEHGDVGRVMLAWPAAASLSAEALVEMLREQVGVEHGRIDPGPEPPEAGYLPVLSVGALVTYTITLDDRFQERAEAWVDGATALPLTVAAAAALASAPRSQALAHRLLPADTGAAAAGAHALLEQRAADRLAVLCRQARGAKDAEVSRVEDYYRAALDSLARRLASAPADRKGVLEARAEATRAERERRLAEVEEKYSGSLDVRWFRVHEVLVPACSIDVVIRRGRREYPYTFRWLLPLRTVAPVACPHCGACSPLVAGKERLGCESCLARRSPSGEVSTGAQAAPVPPVQPAPTSAPAAQRAPTRPATAEPAHDHGTRPHRPTRADAAPAASSRPLGSTAAPVVGDPRRLADDGNRLALKFWQAVADDDRRAGRLVVPGSPADTAVRLWGARGPAVALGIPPGEPPAEMDAQTYPDAGSAIHVTVGQLRSENGYHLYTLRWQGNGRPGVAQVAEIVSGTVGTDARLPSHQVRAWWRSPWLVKTLPAPRASLDPVERTLVEVELPRRGFPLLLRALTAWERAAPSYEGPVGSHVAAALARLVAAAAGTQVSISDVAFQYGADPADVRTAGTDLRRLLRLDPLRGW